VEIKTLPLLEESYSTWSWEVSNGNATDAMMKSASDAILHQGFCSDFHRTVWNDLVDKVAEVITLCNLTWDSTYCAAKDCKISVQYGALTARMFNSVAWNIYRFGVVSWKWSVVKGTGYVGRNTFRGYGSYGANADVLYGWYFIELTDKLNRVIEVLKESADFGEFTSNSLITSHAPVSLFGAGTGVLESTNMIEVFTPTSLTGAKAAPAEVYRFGRSYQKDDLLCVAPHFLQSGVKAETKSQTTGDSLITAAVGGLIESNTKISSVLSPLVFVGYMRHLAYEQTKAIGEIDISNIKDLDSTAYEKIYDSAAVVKLLPYLMDTKVVASSKEKSEVNPVDRVLFGANLIAETAAEAIITKQMPEIMEGASAEYTSITTALDHLRPLYVQRSIKDDSFHVADINAGESSVLEFAESSESTNEVDLIAKRIGALEHAQNVESKVLDSLTIGSGISISATDSSRSKGSALIQKGIPLTLEAVDYSEATEFGEMVIASGVLQESNESEYTESTGAMKLVVPTQLIEFCSTESQVIAEMDLEYSTKDPWRDPVQVGNNVRIWNAHPQWQEGATVHLDAGGIYYDPVQVGNNVYIRSIDSMKEEETKDG